MLALVPGEEIDPLGPNPISCRLGQLSDHLFEKSLSPETLQWSIVSFKIHTCLYKGLNSHRLHIRKDNYTHNISCDV